MTRIAEYPDEITDVRAWRAELAMIAYRDGKLTLAQAAEFLFCSQMDTWRLLRTHGVETRDAEFLLAQELEGVAAFEREQVLTK